MESDRQAKILNRLEELRNAYSRATAEGGTTTTIIRAANRRRRHRIVQWPPVVAASVALRRIGFSIV